MSFGGNKHDGYGDAGDAIGAVGDTIGGDAGDALNTVGDVVSGGTSGLGDRAGDAIGGALNDLGQDIGGDVGQVISDVSGEVGDFLGDVVTAGLDGALSGGTAALGDLGQALVFAESFCRQAERGAHQRHGFAGAAKRARHVIEIRRMSPDLREPIAQNISAVAGLRAAARVERDVVTTLQAAGDVPIGFTVTNVVDRRRRHRR